MFFDLFRRDPDIVKLSVGECLFREGDAGEHMYVIVSGSADVTVRGKLVERTEPGTILGELAVIEPASRRSATVTATTDCVLAKIDATRFHFLVSQTPHFATEVMRVMANRLRRTDAML